MLLGRVRCISGGDCVVGEVRAVFGVGWAGLFEWVRDALGWIWRVGKGKCVTIVALMTCGWVLMGWLTDGLIVLMECGWVLMLLYAVFMMSEACGWVT